MTIENAKIESTMLGYEDHGIPTSFLNLKFGSSNQGFGGYDLRSTSAMLKWVLGVLNVLGVNEWSKVTGQVCRVRREDGRIIAIGHIIDDLWFAAKSIYE